jgi:hypothetical protein
MPSCWGGGIKDALDKVEREGIELPSSTPLTPEEQQREAYTGLPKRHGTFIHPLGSGHSCNKTQQSPSEEEEEEEKGEDDDMSKDSSGSTCGKKRSIIIIINGS